MDEWLDPQTKALLRGTPPLIPCRVDTDSFALLLLVRGADDARIDEAVSAIVRDGVAPAVELPFIVASGLSLEEAFVGQFALACCDCAVSFVPDEVARQADRAWWRQYYREVMQSGDFQQVVVELMDVPPGEAGRRYAWQFLGMATVALPQALTIFRIKAELMEYWGNRLGAVLRRRRGRKQRETRS
jgi:hypothetical protein